MEASIRPEPFGAYTTPAFWDDPHISQRMLRAHLDPENPMASRPAAFLDRSAAWLASALDLTEGSRLLDLGCGPGLYAERFARGGVRVLGIDVSRRSLDHARRTAAREALPATFRLGSYLDADLGAGHDAAVLIFEDYCALSPGQRALLLGRVRAALRAGGRFAFDVTAGPRFATVTEAVVTQPDLMDGFWAPRPYLGTHETWTYPELRLFLDRYTITEGAATRQFWNWVQCLTPEEVADELDAAGFGALGLHGDVAGAPFDAEAPAFAVVAQA